VFSTDYFPRGHPQTTSFSGGGLISEMQHPAMWENSVNFGLSLFSEILHEVPDGLNGAASFQRLTQSVIHCRLLELEFFRKGQCSFRANAKSCGNFKTEINQ
jgi:hypothetical protein